jgi:GDP-L-fucose synthase
MKVLVTGGTGLVGSAIKSICHNYDHEFVFLSSKSGDLTKFSEVDRIFNRENPDMVIHLAACVGGLYKNMDANGTMYERNVMINTNVLSCCVKYRVRKTLSCLSTCIFPAATTYPINEYMLHQGAPHTSNEGYSYAKRMLDVQGRMYRQQYNMDFISVIPTNIYGPNDNYKLLDAHVIPALIYKCYLAKKEGAPFMVLGSGKPLRQFIYSIDLAQLILWSLENYSDSTPLILSPSEDSEVSIGDVARLVAKCFDYEDHIVFQSEFSDGQYKKTADNTRLINRIGSFKFTNIEDGIAMSVKWFVENYGNGIRT